MTSLGKVGHTQRQVSAGYETKLLVLENTQFLTISGNQQRCFSATPLEISGFARLKD